MLRYRAFCLSGASLGQTHRSLVGGYQAHRNLKYVGENVTPSHRRENVDFRVWRSLPRPLDRHGQPRAGSNMRVANIIALGAPTGSRIAALSQDLHGQSLVIDGRSACPSSSSLYGELPMGADLLARPDSRHGADRQRRQRPFGATFTLTKPPETKLVISSVAAPR